MRCLWGPFGVVYAWCYVWFMRGLCVVYAWCMRTHKVRITLMLDCMRGLCRSIKSAKPKLFNKYANVGGMCGLCVVYAWFKRFNYLNEPYVWFMR